MAISRKPKATAPVVDVNKLIHKGGSIAGEGGREGKSGVVNLRIPGELLERIDGAVQSRPVRIPRHTWLMEAIIEKLEREQK